jgi:hypothetical protein
VCATLTRGNTTENTSINALVQDLMARSCKAHMQHSSYVARQMSTVVAKRSQGENVCLERGHRSPVRTDWH